MRNSLFCWLMVVVVVGMVGSVEAGPNMGQLEIKNAANGFENYLSVIHGVINTNPWLAPPAGSSLYSEVGGNKYSLDGRAEDDINDFDIRLVYVGSLGANTPNELGFRFPYSDYKFGSQPILFQSDLLPYGPVIDIRKAIAQNGGVVPLIDLPAGTYNVDTPYGSGILTIGTRKLADLSDNGDIDLEDFSMLASDWQKSGGKYVGDITGPNGIPDGNVDMYDLVEFVSEWLD